MEKIKNFRDLNIWKLGKNLVLDVYDVTKNFPKKRNIWPDFTNATIINFNTIKYRGRI